MISSNFVYLAVIAQFLGGLSYLIDTIKGNIQPNKVSWLLWSVAPLIAFVAELFKGVGIQSLTTFIVGFTPLTIFVASFLNKRVMWKIEKLDIICGALSLCGLVLWFVSREANIAIVFSIMADALAAVPTVYKSYQFPKTENHWVYSTGVLAMGLTLLTITQWNFQTYAFPIYIFLLDLTIFIFIKFRVKSLLSR